MAKPKVVEALQMGDPHQGLMLSFENGRFHLVVQAGQETASYRFSEEEMITFLGYILSLDMKLGTGLLGKALDRKVEEIDTREEVSGS